MWLAIPAYKLTCQFTIRKGKSWSADEESIFRSIATSASTLGALTIQRPTSRTRVFASLDRMMRYGLVESSLVQGRLEYRATPKGAALAADGLPLPFFPKVEARRISFLVERATLRSFLTREVPLMPPAWLDELERWGGKVRRIPVQPRGGDGHASTAQLDRLRTLAARARDELVMDAEVLDPSTPDEGFMVVKADTTVHLPRDAGEALRALLTDAAGPAPRRRRSGSAL